jgi:YgiT-type zinc finger domain-containing protein
MTSESLFNLPPCRDCQAGHMHRRFVTYLTWLYDELITVPDFPAWVCDVCGRCEYDVRALNRLSLLLSPVAGKPSPRKHHRRPHTDMDDLRPSSVKEK